MVSVGSSEGKRPLGRPRCGWEDNIKIDIKQMEGEEDVDWIKLVQDCGTWRAVVTTVMNTDFHKIRKA